jgi:MFS family permease
MASEKVPVDDVVVARSSVEIGDSKSTDDGLPTNAGNDVDVAATFLATLDPAILAEPISAKEYRKLLWKIDLTILPLLWVTTIVGAVDKVIISNAAIYGMRTDAHLGGNEFNWVGSIFYFGYLAFEFPAAILIQRLPVGKFFALTVFAWSVLLMCTAAAQNYGGLLAVRFFMGMFESVIFPTATIVTVMWWRTEEHPIRIACWFSQFSSIFSGIVSYGIGNTHTAIHPWRLLFIVLGAFSLLWAVVLWFLLPDSPLKCWYLSDREKYVAIERVKGNNTGVEDKKIKWYQVRECLTDPKTWLIAIFACAQNIPNGESLVNLLPSRTF